jgi:hypothetical protein
MAQTGYTPISIYYSSTASNTPTAGNLVAGELAINTADGKLFYKDSAGVVQVIGTKGGVGSSTTTQVLYNSSGLVVGSANMTFNGTTLTLANDASISGLTVGKGLGSIATNTAVGANALGANTTGNRSVAVGFSALPVNTTGEHNVAIGSTALSLNTTGSYNVGVGREALTSNTTASNNTAVGYQAGYSNTTGGSNTVLGYRAGYTNSTGTQNLYLGGFAGYAATGNYNTFVGAINSAGSGSGEAVTTGSKNTILGGYSGNQGGLDIRTASNYIVLSDGDGNVAAYWDGQRFGATQTASSAGYAWAARQTSASGGGYPLICEYTAQAPNDTTYRFITCRDSATPSTGKMYVYSNGNIVNTNNSYGSLSDQSIKENVVDATPKLESLCKVKIRNYNIIGEEIKQIGVVAQELETVFPSMVDVDGESGLKQVKYSVFVPMLIKAIQELKAEVDSLKQQLGK